MAASRPIMMFCSEPWLASLTEKWPTRIAGTSGRCPTCAASAPIFAYDGVLERGVEVVQALALLLFFAQERGAQGDKAP